MTCPDLYIGATRALSPPSPPWQNPAIQPPSTNLVEGVGVVITVYVRNHGTDDAPATQLQLHYANPSTGFIPIGSIGDWDFDGTDMLHPFIPGATVIPAADGEVFHNFAWTPPPRSTLPNGGHICLLARVYNTAAPGGKCTQEVYGATPPTDKLQGIRNIHVIEPPPPPPSPAPGGGGGNGNGFMAFAFAATNTLRHLEDTRLSVRALEPDKDRDRLQTLVSDPAVDKALRARRLTFGVPKGVLVAEGRERALYRLGRGHSLKVDPCAQPFNHLGPLSPLQAEYLALPGSKPREAKKPFELKLLPGEARQTIVWVEPSGKRKAVYVVEVEHEGADGQAIGGLTLIFVPPHDYF